MGGKHSKGRKKVEPYLSDKDEKDTKIIEVEKQTPLIIDELPEISDPSKLLSETTRHVLYASLPARCRGCRWLMLYSTWKNGMSLGTLYRRSMIYPGPSLLIVGDSKGTVFGGLVEAPLKQNSRKYQGTTHSFVFTTKTGETVIYRPTGANRYFTLCSNSSLAVGGGGNFALYLDEDMLSGSSKVSLTYGNPCLAQAEEFEVKEVELWGFVHSSKYEEVIAQSKTEEFGISRW